MNVRDLPQRANDAVNRWLTASETNAAGRMGLFRMIYGLFALWYLSRINYLDLGRTADAAWQPIAIDHWVLSVPPVSAILAIQAVCVFALVLLIAGYHVRLATAVVLITGIALEAVRYSFGKVDHSTLFLSLYIPLFMLLGRWGDTYSLDSALKTRRTGKRVAATETSWRFIWPARAVLLVLSVLFLTAAYWKAVHGTWETNPMTLHNLLLTTAMGNVADGSSIAPVLLPLLRVPLLTTAMQVATLAFEGLFFVSLFNRTLRNWFLALAVIFHGMNLILLNVNFVPQVIAYLIFIDWQALYARWIAPHLPHSRPANESAAVWGGVTVAAAAAAAFVWTFMPDMKRVLSLGELVTTRSVWLVMLPIAMVVWLRTSLDLICSLRARLNSRHQPVPSP